MKTGDIESPSTAGSITRRDSLSALAASVGIFALGGTHAAVATPPSANRDSGVRVYNVRDYGAKGDGTTLETVAVQATINACNRDGGGTVLIPAGTFLVGTLELKSNVTLHLAAAARLQGSGKGSDYHGVDAIPLSGDSTLDDGNWALVFAVDATNITIEGPGTIDGQGAQFHSPVRGTPPPSGLGGRKRPYHLLFYRCENLAIRDIDLLDSAYHSVRMIHCRRVQMRGIYIHNRVNGNNDGFHFISSEYVTVSDCTVMSLDDACALFGSCRNVTVTNSMFSTRWSVFRFGGGVAENIAVSNCVLHQVYGCPIKFHGTPGSRFENMSFSNLVLDDVTGPIHISIGPKTERNPNAGPTPVDALSNESREPAVVRNISFSNIHGTVTTNPQQMAETTLTSKYNPGEQHSCIALNCVGGATLENVSFENIHLIFGGGGTMEDAARRDLPEIAGEYFMLGPMPAYAFYARNSRGVTLNNVRFEFKTPDLRPALIFDQVTDASINGWSVQADAGAESVARFIDVKQVLITATRLLTPAKAFLRLEGSRNEEIVVDGGDLSRAQMPLVFKDGVDKSAVKLRG
jgi:polygalacturonase